VNKINFSTQNYWLNIDKPSGISSAKVVAIVKRLTKAKKVGHAGTLDPLACGVLPVAVNSATRTAEYICDEEKEYFVTIKWGEFRDSDDLEGTVECKNNFIPTSFNILNGLSNFCGDIQQVPSKFSAIKINGVRSYKIAYKQDYDIPQRNIRIKKIFFINSRDCYSDFIITCSKGTYIRSFVRELAIKIGAYGFMYNLNRIKVGMFNQNNIISLDKLKFMIRVKNYFETIVAIDSALSNLGSIFVTEGDFTKLNQGQIVSFSADYSNIVDEVVKLKFQGNVFGIGELSEGIIKPRKIFN